MNSLAPGSYRGAGLRRRFDSPVIIAESAPSCTLNVNRRRIWGVGCMLGHGYGDRSPTARVFRDARRRWWTSSRGSAHLARRASWWVGGGLAV